MPDLETAFAAMAADYWKLLRSFERVANSAPHDNAQRLLAQARFAGTRLAGHLSEAGMELVTFDGQEISPNIPVMAINSDECDDYTLAVVASTVEPAIIAGGRVLLQSRVVAAEGEK